MAWGFRESIKIGPFRLNINKRSVSGTVRAGRASVTVNSRGERSESLRLGGGFSLRHRSRRG